MTGLYVATNPNALNVQFRLSRNMGALAETLTRLSTGLRINSGKDDPAGLIASELLKSDITGTTKAISNTQRANMLLQVADSSLGRIGNLLNDIRGLVVESANTGAMSAGQIEANQLQIDASIDAVDRIARSTTFQGQKLLDGSLDFSTRGIDKTAIDSLAIHSANFGTKSNLDVNVRVLEEARQGFLQYHGTGVSQNTTIDVTGSAGTKTFRFGAGTTNREMADAISALSDSTGVTAHVEGGSSRGSVVLSSAGAGNDIVITALEDGFDAGNYSFRIVHGAVNDVAVISEPSRGKPGVVEITLEESHEQHFGAVADLFNITIDTGFAGEDAATQPTSVHLTRGTSNSALFYEQDSTAVGRSGNGKSIVFGNVPEDEGHVSAVDGWTVLIDDSVEDTEFDLDNKTIRMSSENATEDDIAGALSRATGTAGEVSLIGAPANGDRFTLNGGGDTGQLFITYKEGATAGEILDLINRAPNVQASLVSGVSRNEKMPNLPDGRTYVEGTGENTPGRFQSGATAQTVIDLINSKLGDKFSAHALNGDGTGGRVSFMNAAVDYGDVNLDNALRFTGTDASPIVRLVTGGANRELGISLRYPSEADIDAGIKRPILEIQLATNGSGDSISTARDIAELFDRLTPEETLGVSAEVLSPPGVDPNGRSWNVDACGNVVVRESCPPDFGLGIVEPTGKPGLCEIQQNDLVLLGRNQKIIEGGYPVATIRSATSVVGIDAVAHNPGESVSLDFGPTSALNGVSFTFTKTQSDAGFDSSTGRLNVYIDPSILTQSDPDLTESLIKTINGQIKQNWSAIGDYTHAVGDPPKVLEITGPEDLLDIVDGAGEEAVLTIGGVSGSGGGGSGSRGTASSSLYNTGGDVTVPFTLTTNSDTSDLNTVTIVLRDIPQPTYSGGVLSASYTTPSVNDQVAAAVLIEEAINQAIAQFFSSSIKVSIATDDTLFTDTIPNSEIQQLSFAVEHGASPGGGETETPGGVGTDDPALRLVSKEKGTYFTGVNVAFVEHNTLPEGRIEVEYDENIRKMIVRGNTGGTGTMDSDVLAELLNGDKTFRKYCDEIDPVRDVTPDTAVAFGPTADSSGRFVGGYKIVTESDGGNASDGTSSSGTFASSYGISMTGMSDSGERLVLTAVETGSGNFVKVHVAEGSFDTYDGFDRRSFDSAGTDMLATVNGSTVRARGNRLEMNTADLSLSLSVANRKGETSFQIDGGGALFQLGTNVVSTQQIRVSLSNMTSTHLGGSNGLLYELKSGNAAAMNADTKLADRIVNDAIRSVAVTRGRIGAIQRSTLEPNIEALQDGLVSLTAAESSISNADFAEESSNMLRLQILIQAGANVLAQANQLPQYAASLVR